MITKRAPQSGRRRSLSKRGLALFALTMIWFVAGQRFAVAQDSGVSITISPSDSSLFVSETQQFSAAVSGATNTSVTWSVAPWFAGDEYNPPDPTDPGSITASGLYTPPSSINHVTGVIVSATSVQDPSVSAQTYVSLNPLQIFVSQQGSNSPNPPTIEAGQTVRFVAQVYGTSNQSVTWSMPTDNDPIGEIDQDGNYTAPSQVAVEQGVRIRATSVVDPSISGYADISVKALTGLLQLSNSQTPRGTDGTILFTIQIPAGHSVSAVQLSQLDQAGAIFSSLGQMHDDGLNGDVTANDGIYSLQLSLPTDKVGAYQIRADVSFADVSGIISAPVESFWVFASTEQNSDGSLSADNSSGQALVNWILDESWLVSGREVVSYSTSSSGPWTVLSDENYDYTGADPNLPLPSSRTYSDPAASHTSVDSYYKVDLYDLSGSLRQSLSPVFLPANIRTADGKPVTIVLSNGQAQFSQGAPGGASPQQARPLTRMSAMSTSGASCSLTQPWNMPFMTNEEFSCTRCLSYKQITAIANHYQSWWRGTTADVDGTQINISQIIYDQAESNGINPELLLAIAQAESSTTRAKSRPTSLLTQKLLMGCGRPSTIRDQISCAATSLSRNFQTAVGGGSIVGHWQPGTPAATLDQSGGQSLGLQVTPANAATAALYAYTPFRGSAAFLGSTWGGQSSTGWALRMGVMRQTLNLWAWDPQHGSTDPSVDGNAAQESLPDYVNSIVPDKTINLPTRYETYFGDPENRPGSYDADYVTSGDRLTVVLPPACSYTVTLDVHMLSYTNCSTTGNPDEDPNLDANPSSDCFVASIDSTGADDWSNSSWNPGYRSHPGFIGAWGGGEESSFTLGRFYKTITKTVVADPANTNYLNIFFDGYRYDGYDFPSWGSITIDSIVANSSR